MTDTPRPLRDSALLRLKGTFKSKDLLLPLVERHVMRSMGQADPERSTDFLHPSDMCKAEWCGRHDYYRMVGTAPEKTSKRNPSFRMENIFAEGHSIHDKWQRWMWEMGVLIGYFLCNECGHYWYAMSPVECQFCQSPRLVYKEYPLRRERYRVEGHADGAVHLPDDRALVEIKSIGLGTLRFEAPRLYNRYLDGETAEDIWMSITHPFGTHMRQGQLYLWMSWPLYEQIIFIYESKFHQQTKEFVVEYNKSLIAPILETAKEVAQGYRAGIPPDRPVWVTGPDGKVCNACVYKRTCWGGTEDAHEETPVTTPIRRGNAGKRRRALRKT